ncbi:hypothetical protein F5876DRAFT_70577 [Lentinula aff. lateritia]|uniref:Uncharacterized protein n=1 Tax=Lentinula aff. lateritia TaxID=2804960 RepID=A0ACC1TIY8_9AGAR|nr:hypothetical protein F5876DRAFT_70577 [Lentinula aff. lateritia]
MAMVWAYCKRYGIRFWYHPGPNGPIPFRCDFSAAMLAISAWIRYAGTVKSLLTNSSEKSLWMLNIQSIVQPIDQVLGPKYSENWFNLQDHTTATIVVVIANPVGSAIEQLLSPLVGGTRQSILVLGIISTAVIPFIFLVHSQPLTSPTYAASTPSASFSHLAQDVIFGGQSHGAKMSRRQWTNTFSILTSQIMKPVGYLDNISGLRGFINVLNGDLDRLTIPLLCLLEKNQSVHEAFGSFRKGFVADAWRQLVISHLGWGNLFNIVFVLVEDTLRAPANADPPLNMRRGLIFNRVFMLEEKVVEGHGGGGVVRGV